MCFDDEEYTTTTTITTDNYPIAGSLVKLYENSQPYVVDPVDHSKVWLNSRDDMYEDATGKIWNLI